MAPGSMRQMRSYAVKVFAKDDRRGRMTDGRRDPTLPLSAVLATWQGGLIRRTPSTEPIGDLLLDRRWRARRGLKPEGEAVRTGRPRFWIAWRWRNGTR